MSIYIKGMEMPKEGVEWICFVRFTNRTAEFFDPTGESESIFYEAVEVPGNGRLIDADALIAHLKADPLWKLVDQYGVESVIEAVPTIIPADKEADDD